MKRPTGPVVVATALDEGFALPTSVMLASLVGNLGAGVEVRLFLLEDEVSESSKRRIESVVAGAPVTLRWISPDMAAIADTLPRGDHPVVPASYFRLLLPELIPRDVKRIVYLDGDLVVLGDIAELWRLDLRGHLALAVPDSYSRAFHTSRLSSLRVAELPTFDADSSYFNSGVMLIDLAGWREHRVGAQALRWARTYTKELGFYDQDALNCALHGRWGRLDVAWNFHEIPGMVRTWEAAQYDREELGERFADPKIVHFTASPKPWQPLCNSVYARLFLEYLALTPWKGWRPRGAPLLRRWRQALYGRPRTLLDWYLWRGAVQSRDPALLWRAVKTVARYPWLLVTYPCACALRVPSLSRSALRAVGRRVAALSA